jgi:hypothetical protein
MSLPQGLRWNHKKFEKYTSWFPNKDMDEKCGVNSNLEKKLLPT